MPVPLSYGVIMLAEGKKSVVGEFFESIIIAVVLATLIRLFLFQPFFIPSGSMEPTLRPGDRIIVNKIIYRLTEPRRGDVLVFRYPLDPQKDYIKRVVGLGGETVGARNGELIINNQVVPEPYLPAGLAFNDFGPIQVPGESFFMMGDNRNNSQDSRVWGPVPANHVVGKAVLIFWPLNRIGLIR